MKVFSGNTRQLTRLLLGIPAIIGIAILAAFLSSPSEAGNQFLFGYSRGRLAVAAIFALLLIANLSAVIWLSLKPVGGQSGFESKLITWLVDHLILVIVILYCAVFVTGLLLLAIIPPVIKAIHFLEPMGARIGGLLFWSFLASSLLIVLFRITYRDVLRENRVVARMDRFLLLSSIFLFTFFLYEHLLIWSGAANQTRYSYWNLLADEFLKGKLYLEKPPTTHDLTPYQGRWYIPMPPLPAVMMMPLAYLIGGENISTSDFSILFSAINAVLVFLILEQLAARKWIGLSRTGMILLVILFAFGNPHLWVGIRGRAWFVSQIITVFFLALAVLGTLRSWSPWLVGICLGAAILTRPNGLLTLPFAFAIAMQITKEERGAVTLNHIMNWSVKSIIPIAAAIGLVLFYNYARFENFLDFGYTTINGDPAIAANAQRYGIFSPHFIPSNLKAMFLDFPAIVPGGQWPLLPSSTGMSIFLVTPPFIYLFHRYEYKWWILGAWTSIFLNFVLLALYHNTGAHQFGYRYVLDAIVPIMAMLAVALNEKIPRLFIFLLLFSIAFNIYGAYWFING